MVRFRRWDDSTGVNGALRMRDSWRSGRVAGRYSRRQLLRGFAGAGLGITGVVTLASCATPPASPTAEPTSAAPVTTSGPAAGAVASPTAATAPRKLGGQFRIQEGSADAPHLDIHM